MSRLKVIILTIAVFGAVLTNCTKEPEDTNLELHKLKEGTICYFYRISRVTKHVDSQGYDSIFKVKKGLYKYKVVSERYLIDTIQLFKGSNNIYISRQRVNPVYYPIHDTENYNWGKLFEADFKNAHLVTEDSIVGQYYNTHYYNSGERKAVPDSGIFAIKILQ
jgi:hypothetical protein